MRQYNNLKDNLVVLVAEHMSQSSHMYFSCVLTSLPTSCASLWPIGVGHGVLFIDPLYCYAMPVKGHCPKLCSKLC